MKIKVLLADDSDVVRGAIVGLLEKETSIQVAEALDFAQTVLMISDFKPDVLLLDLHLVDKCDGGTASVKAELAGVHVLAISFSYDDEAKALAESYGATALLDKIKLSTDLIPAIKTCAALSEPAKEEPAA